MRLEQEHLEQLREAQEREAYHRQRERDARAELFRLRQEQTVEQPHAGEDDTRPKSLRGKLENFWYYHKWQLLVSVVLIGFFGSVLADTLLRQPKDITVVLVTANSAAVQKTDALRTFIERYCEDFNGDGKVRASVAVQEFDSGTLTDPQGQQKNRAKLQAQLDAGKALLYVTDDMVADKLLGGGEVFVSLTNIYRGQVGIHGAHDSLLYLDTLKSFQNVFPEEDAEVFEGFSIALCDASGVSSGGDTVLDRFSQAKAVLNRIVADQPYQMKNELEQVIDKLQNESGWS